MPRDTPVLEYAQSPVLRPHRGSILPHWTTIRSAVALLLLATPAALLPAVLGYVYPIFGVLAFFLAAFLLAQIFPSPLHRLRILCASALFGIAVTALLHVASLNELIVENRSGQTIARITIDEGTSASGFTGRNIPDGLVHRVTFHHLFFDGRFLGCVMFADGTSFDCAPANLDPRTYRGKTRLIIGPGGITHVIHE